MAPVVSRHQSWQHQSWQHQSWAVLADGAFVIVWQSAGSDGTDTDGFSIQAQRFDSAGVAAGGELQVNTYTTSSQTKPAIDAGDDHPGSGDLNVCPVIANSVRRTAPWRKRILRRLNIALAGVDADR